MKKQISLFLLLAAGVGATGVANAQCTISFADNAPYFHHADYTNPELVACTVEIERFCANPANICD